MIHRFLVMNVILQMRSQRYLSHLFYIRNYRKAGDNPNSIATEPSPRIYQNESSQFTE